MAAFTHLFQVVRGSSTSDKSNIRTLTDQIPLNRAGICSIPKAVMAPGADGDSYLESKALSGSWNNGNSDGVGAPTRQDSIPGSSQPRSPDSAALATDPPAPNATSLTNQLKQLTATAAELTAAGGDSLSKPDPGYSLIYKELVKPAAAPTLLAPPCAPDHLRHHHPAAASAPSTGPRGRAIGLIK